MKNRAEEIMDKSIFCSMGYDSLGEIFYVNVAGDKYACVPMDILKEIYEVTKPPYPVSPLTPMHELLEKISRTIFCYIIK